MKRSFKIIIYFLLWVNQTSATEAIYDNFFSAMQQSEQVIIVEFTPTGSFRPPRTLFDQALPADIVIPESWQNKFATPGLYLIPYQGNTLISHRAPLPQISDRNSIAAMLAHYSMIPKLDEPTALKKFIQAIGNPTLQENALRRMREIGFFDEPFTAADAEFFHQTFRDSNLSVPARRLLLEAFAKCNFLIMEAVFRDELQDRHLSKLAGAIYAESAPSSFADLLSDYIKHEEKWPIAISHSAFMLTNQNFIDEAMIHYNYEAPFENPVGFIPLLLKTNLPNNANIQAVKFLLTNSKDTQAHELYRTLGQWLNQINPDVFQEEIELFLRNNKKNTYIYNSSIYPAMLAALCKTSNSHAAQMTLDYLQYLQRLDNQPLKEAVGLLFREANRSNPAIPEIIETLRLRL